MSTFAEQVAAAYDTAWKMAAPWVPSMAQIEAELVPIVDQLRALPHEEAATVIRSTFTGRGAEPMALAMYKQAHKGHAQ